MMLGTKDDSDEAKDSRMTAVRLTGMERSGVATGLCVARRRAARR